MHTHIMASTDWPCVLNHKLVINFLGYLDTKMWDLAMTNTDVQPVGRGEEARAGLGETGQSGMEDQLCDPNWALDGTIHAGPALDAQFLAPLWPSGALAPVSPQGMM